MIILSWLINIESCDYVMIPWSMIWSSPRNGDYSHTQSQDIFCIAFNSNSEWRGWLRKQSLLIIYDEDYYAGVNFEIHQVRTFGGRDVRWGGEQHFGDCEVDFDFSIKHWITFEGHSIRNFAINIH